MVLQGPPGPLGGGQSVPPSLLRSNSGLLGGQGSSMNSQNAFPSMAFSRNQFNNMNMIGNAPNVSSMLHQSFGNGGPSPGVSGPGSFQRGLIDGGAESDPLSSVGNGMAFNNPSSSFMSSAMTSNHNSAGQDQGQQQQQQQFSSASVNGMLTDQQQGQQLDPQNFQNNQRQFAVPSNPQQPHQQFQGMRGGLGGVGPVKVESQANNDQPPQQQLQALHNLGSVKLEPHQQLQGMRSVGPVKMEPQNSDPSLFLQQQQQQQQHVLSRQPSQAATTAQILHQQRLIQMQQQQLLKSMPQQRSPLQQQFQPPNLPNRSPVKPSYEPGMCARRLTHYMYQQQHRPEDNNIEFWRKFVAEYFAPNAKKKWCVSMYGSGRQTTGVFPQDVWHCEICNRKPGRGFEATAEVLPRLFKIKYESGTLEELLYVDMPREYQNSSGQIVLDYAKAIQESVFEQLRVVREGQLRLVFSPDLKICSWEFCARRHEELIPRRLLIPQVSQLGAAAQKCQAATQNAPSSVSTSELQNNCNMFVSSARQLAKALEVPLVNDLGYTKRYVRCLQISEVVNSMKDLIDYSRHTGTGPMESLTKFGQRTKSSAGFQGQPQQTDGQQQHGGGPGHNPFDIFESFFGGNPFGGGGSSRGRRQRRGEDVIHPLKVSLEDLYNGTSKKLSLSRNVLCPKCKGKGSKSGASLKCSGCQGSGMKVSIRHLGPSMIQQMQHPCNECKGTGETISDKDRCTQCKGEKVSQEKKVLEVVVEKGMQHGQKITFPGEADEAPDTVTGDIVFVLQQKEHPKFKRKGDDLFVEHTLTLTEALCGFQFILTHLDNRQLLIKSEPGEVIKPDQFKAINDEGMPMYQRSFMKGKLYIQFTVDFPDSLMLDQSKALESVLPARPSTKLTAMEVDECEETTLHDVNMEDEMRRKQQAAQEAYDEDDDMHGGAQRVQCAQQ